MTGAAKKWAGRAPHSPKDALERVKNRLRGRRPTRVYQRGGGGCDMSDDDMDTATATPPVTATATVSMRTRRAARGE